MIAWPDAETQEVIARFLEEDPLHGYEMCFMLGVYRQQGYALAEAAQMARTGFVRKESPGD